MTATAHLRRRIERRFYRVLYRAYRLALPTRVGAGPVDPRGLRRILVLPNYKVGDLVVATPALAYLRAVAPHARIDVVLSPRNASLVANDPRVDRVLLHDPHAGGWALLRWAALARRLRRERYDLVADFVLPHHVREGLLTAVAAGRQAARVTPHRPPPAWGLFTHRPRVPGFERRYMADRLLYAVQATVRRAGDPVDIDAARAAYPMVLAVDPAANARVAAWLAAHAPGPFIAVNAWASDPVRTLDVRQMAELLAALGARHPGLAFVLTPPPGAAATAAAMQAAAVAAGTRAFVFPPAPDLADLVALLHRAAAVVTPDTANIHLAAAVGRPVLALFATVATARVAHWVPSGVPCHVVLLEGGRPLRDLAPERAATAFDALWDEATSAGHAGAALADVSPADAPSTAGTPPRPPRAAGALR